MTDGKLDTGKRQEQGQVCDVEPFAVLAEGKACREQQPAHNTFRIAIDSDWTLQVKGYTVSVLPAKIPPFPGD
jgi:hypothetical protein